jgi:hypothetical protein
MRSDLEEVMPAGLSEREARLWRQSQGWKRAALEAHELLGRSMRLVEVLNDVNDGVESVESAENDVIAEAEAAVRRVILDDAVSVAAEALAELRKRGTLTHTATDGNREDTYGYWVGHLSGALAAVVDAVGAS